MNQASPFASRCIAILASAASLLVVVGCVPIARKAECVAAEQCDNAREEPFDSFAATDAQFGDVGTCWQNEETAKACVNECNAFIADELAIAKANNNVGVIDACGG